MPSEIVQAVADNNIDKVKSLLKQGQDPNQVDEHGNSLLMIACYIGNAEIASLLLDRRANANEKIKINTEEKKSVEEKIPDRYRTPLHFAVEAKNTRLVELLLAKGAEVDVRDNFSHTALHNAAWLGLLDIVKALIKHDADINARTQFGETPLYLACSTGSNLSNKEKRLAVIKHLLEHGADPAIGKEFSGTPLEESYDQHYKTDDIEVIKLLIQHSAKVSKSAIEYFTQHGYQDVLELIKKKGNK